MTATGSIQFQIVAGPNMEDILLLLRGGNTDKQLYFVCQQAEYVSDPLQPKSLPRLEPVEDAPRKRMSLEEVTGVRRLPGGSLPYELTCAVDVSLCHIQLQYDPYQRFGQVALVKGTEVKRLMGN